MCVWAMVWGLVGHESGIQQRSPGQKKCYTKIMNMDMDSAMEVVMLGRRENVSETSSGICES